MINAKRYCYAHLLALVLAGAFSFTGNAQQPTLKTIRAGRPSMVFGSIVVEGDSFVACGTTSGLDAPYRARAVIAKLGNNASYGTAYYVNDSIGKNYGSFYNSLIRTTEGGYAFTGYSYDTVPKVLFVRTGPDLQPEYDEFDSTDLYSFQGLYLLQHDIAFYIAGVIRPNNISGYSDNVLIKIDKYGSRLWQKRYGTLPNAENATSLIKLNNGNLMIGSYRRDYETPIETANTWLMEVDTAGEIVRQWFDDNDSTLGGYGLKQTSDGGFIYGAQNIYIQSINGPYFIGSIVKLDSNFNVQWRWTGGYPRDLTGIYDIEELPDGSFVGCGNSTYLNGTVMIGAWVVKLTSGGQEVWNRYYSAFNSMDSENYLNDIDLLPNGNFVAVGETRDFTEIDRGQMGLLMVLDSNGCVIENCTVGINDIEPKIELSIYPNPANDMVSISIKNAMIHNATITISNPMGQIMQKMEGTDIGDGYSINLSGYAKGLYFVAIHTGGETVVKQVVKQ